MKRKTTHTRNKLSGIEHYNGLGMSPRPVKEHQKIIGRIYRNISLFLEAKNKSNLEVYIETEADFNKTNSLTPDVSIYKEGETTPIWILEVERTKGIKKTIEKIEGKFLPNYPSIREAFLYDYEKGVWYRFDCNGMTQSYQSTVLKRSMARMLKLTFWDMVLWYFK